MTESLFFVHFSDTHIQAPDKKTLFDLDTTAKLRAAFAHVRTLERKPAFVVISGDLTQDGDTNDYRHLKAVLDEEMAALDIPLYVALGNHDYREPFCEGFLRTEPSGRSYYYSALESGLRLIVLNTQTPGTHSGRLDTVQLDWLRRELATPAPLGTIVVLHHPVVPTPTALMDKHLLDNPADLERAIAGSDVIGLLAGHIHYANIGLFAGVPCAAAAGVAFGLDPSTERSMRFLDNSGYNLVVVKDGRMVVQPVALPGEQKLRFEWKLEAKAGSHA